MIRQRLRRPAFLGAVAAVAATALIAAGLAAALAPAASAQAAASLTLNPPVTTVRAVPLAFNVTDVRAQSTYGVSVAGLDTSLPLRMLVTASSFATLKGVFFQAVPTGGLPAAIGPWLVADTSSGPTGDVVLTTSPTSTQTVYIGPGIPGVYQLVFWQDTDGDNGYDPAVDATASAITYSVVDIYPPTNGPSDGNRLWSVATTPATVALGGQASTTISLPPIATVDVRGTIGNGDDRGVLGTILAGTDGTNGSVTLAYTVPGAGKVLGKLRYDGLSTNPAGLSYPTYSATSPALTVPGLLGGTAKIGQGGVRKDTETVIGAPVTLSAPLRVLLGSKIRLTGTADPGARVGIYVQPDRSPGGFLLATTVTANADGAFGLGTTPKGITSYQANVNGKTARVDVRTTTAVTAKAKALGGGKVQFTVNGKPSRAGYINVYEDGVRIGHVKSDKYGDGVLVVQSSPGRRTFTAGFQVAGSDVGTTSITGTVQ